MSVEPMEPFFKEIKEKTQLSMTGNYAAAGGVTQTDPDVICAFPITPQTQSVEGLADVVNHGTIKSAFVNVESELAACSFSTAACAAGARTFTATASQGYLMMAECLPMAAGWRLPLTMLVSARSFNSPNLSIWNGWEFTMIDMGWNCIFSENVQETYDAAILACRMGEECQFPMMFVHDGFITSHSAQKFFAIPTEDVRKFTPKKPRHHINPQNPGTWGSIVYPTYFTEGRLALDKAKEGVLGQMTNVFKDFEKMTGRAYHHIELYNMDQAKTVFVTMGSVCGNILTWMQKSGRKDVGLIKLRTWRPFPTAELRKIAEQYHIEKMIVLEKDDDLSLNMPPVGRCVAAAVSNMDITTRAFITGLGGRDTTKDEIEYAAEKMKTVKGMSGRLYDFLGARDAAGKFHEVRF